MQIKIENNGGMPPLLIMVDKYDEKNNKISWGLCCCVSRFFCTEWSWSGIYRDLVSSSRGILKIYIGDLNNVIFCSSIIEDFK